MHNSIATIFASVVIIGLLFGGAYYFSTKDGPQSPSVLDPSDSDGQKNFDTEDSITAQHQFVDGTHTIAGEVALPTPCHRMEHDLVIRESFPEQVTIAFSASMKDGEVCAQVITPKRFKYSFEASEGALITATYNGESAILNLIKIGAGETLEDFDVFIKD